MYLNGSAQACYRNETPSRQRSSVAEHESQKNSVTFCPLNGILGEDKQSTNK